MTDVPEDYNDLVEFIENNDAGVVAQIIQNHYTRNSEIEELAEDLEYRVSGPWTLGEPSYWKGIREASEEIERIIND